MSISEIQSKLKAPKGQNNSFGGYKFRSCEDIVEAAKPILNEYKYSLNISDEMIMLGDRFYIKATASIFNDKEIISSAVGFAREPQNKKGFDEAQITGASSSYARKYALNGLFAIDDTKDADTNEHKKELEEKPIQLITVDQATVIHDLIKETNSDLQKFLQAFGIKSIQNMQLNKYNTAISALNKKKESK